ncbi:hypothetical protein OQA88_1137 [Cercophora sp. LCS_1]
MQFSTLPVLALFAIGALAMPSNVEVIKSLEARADCGFILPACNGGRVVGQTNCRCPGQKATCDLWSCPGGAPNVMVCGQQGTGCVWI